MDLQFTKDLNSYLFHRALLKKLEDDQKRARERLMEYIAGHGLQDDRGSLVIEFDDPITIEGVTYTGIMNQRRASEYLDTDKVEKLAVNKDLRERMVHMEEVWDYDEIYVLYQEGLITEEEFDWLMDVTEQWALVPLKM
jgi:hypothetical protein